MSVMETIFNSVCIGIGVSIGNTFYEFILKDYLHKKLYRFRIVKPKISKK